MADLDAFEEQHTRLRGTACRITGPVATTADAAVEETWPRRQALPDGGARDPRPYAGTTSPPAPAPPRPPAVPVPRGTGVQHDAARATAVGGDFTSIGTAATEPGC
ncbi:hypothetical protein [Streptomyces altiplanensis]